MLHLDGTTDWIVAQRNALLAWTGHTLSPSAKIQSRLSLAHWGSTHLTGRGLAALAAPGQVYKLTLGDGEELVAHPGSVVAYAVSRHAPQPFRFKSAGGLRLQLPSLPASWTPKWEWLEAVRNSEAYKFLGRVLYSLRTVSRRTIWGDRLFLQFRGPGTLLMSSRGVRVSDVLTTDQVNEIADAPAGALREALQPAKEAKPLEAGETKTEAPVSKIEVTKGERDGKVTFEDSKSLKEVIR